MTANVTRRAALLGAAGILAMPAVLRAQGQVRLTLDRPYAIYRIRPAT